MPSNADRSPPPLLRLGLSSATASWNARRQRQPRQLLQLLPRVRRPPCLSCAEQRAAQADTCSGRDQTRELIDIVFIIDMTITPVVCFLMVDPSQIQRSASCVSSRSTSRRATPPWETREVWPTLTPAVRPCPSLQPSLPRSDSPSRAWTWGCEPSSAAVFGVVLVVVVQHTGSKSDGLDGQQRVGRQLGR